MPPGLIYGVSARELILPVDQVRIFAFTGLRAAQEVDLLGDDLAAVAIGAGGVGPPRVVDAAVDEDLHALFAVLGDRLAKTVEAGDAVPFGVPGSEQFASLGPYRGAVHSGHRLP